MTSADHLLAEFRLLRQDVVLADVSAGIRVEQGLGVCSNGSMAHGPRDF
jgi:hypothetical protein